jgi:predicted MFS family arabinose efflux permease
MGNLSAPSRSRLGNDLPSRNRERAIRIPRGPLAALAALRLDEPSLEALASLDAREWDEALRFCDRAQLTLALREAARGAMPEAIRDRTDCDAAKATERRGRALGLYRDLARWLGGEGIDFVALKGITHDDLLPYPRVQFDIDLFCPEPAVFAARDLLVSRGFESLAAMEEFPTDHLPPLIRKTGWEWRGDFFDPEIPFPIELHFRFWDEETERLPAPRVEGFWERRAERRIEDVRLAALDPVDALGYSALHLLRHVLRGNLRLSHAYELARALDARAGDDRFWRLWIAWHPEALRRLEAAAFRLALAWFGGQASVAVREEMERLPASSAAWFERFAASPVRAQFEPNKDELWLHWSLMESAHDRIAVARRRLLPLRPPGPVDAVFVPEGGMTRRRRALRAARYARFALTRVGHHLRALPGVAASGWRWRRDTAGFGAEFRTFLATASLFNFAMFMFVLLYNLRLLGLGFREDFLGAVSGAGAAGCVAGAVPAAYLARRFGLRAALLFCCGATAGISALRALATTPAPLVTLAFANGIVFSIWAVSIAPMVARAVDEKRRPAAFSVFFGSQIGLGVAGGWIGGRLPALAGGHRNALLAAAGLAALSLVPASRLKRGRSERPAGARTFPRGAFILRFLAPFALWHLATGSFNPFFNAYFARLGFPPERIGAVFSGSQMAEALAVLLAPAVLRGAGLVPGIVLMMGLTAAGLAGLAAAPGAAAAGAAYICYIVFQWMSEPGMSTLLMNHVREHEREGACALTYLAAFSAQALAAVGGGAAVARAGYGATLAGVAALAVAAAALFQILLGAKKSLPDGHGSVRLASEPRPSGSDPGY